MKKAMEVAVNLFEFVMSQKALVAGAELPFDSLAAKSAQEELVGGVISRGTLDLVLARQSNPCDQML
jgi:hypothetical protein